MNLYGYVPVNCFPSNSALTYWAQAASIAGLTTSDPILSSSGLGLKKPQLSLTASDVIKNRLALSRGDELTALFAVSPRVTAYSADLTSGISHNAHIHHHHHHQQQQHDQQNQHFFSVTPPLGSGLAPLQALCESDVSAFTSKSSAGPGDHNPSDDPKAGLKFGISRILSDDFGKSRCEKENTFQLSTVPEACRSLTLCPCNSIACTAYTRPLSPYHKGPIPSLSAVHALQPPSYPLSSSSDALPGPYSILSADNSFPNQPKRKRSWSRAVFSNLQRKGLERRFEVQKYVTKPDRRQLAAMLGLTDAQVKVWFQNRRMKWRHAQQQGEKDKQIQQPENQAGSELTTQNSGSGVSPEAGKLSIRETQSDDVIESIKAPNDPHKSVSGISLLSKAASHDHVTSPSHQPSPSPQDLSVRLVPDCASDLRPVMTSPCDLRTEPSMEVVRICNLTPVRHHGDGQSPDKDITLSRLRHMCESPSEEETSSDALGGQLDLSDSSPPCLGANSELDINDTDVDMNDTDVDMNDTDVDMNDTNDEERETIVMSMVVDLKDIKVNNELETGTH